jgi:hypothetical protein
MDVEDCLQKLVGLDKLRNSDGQWPQSFCVDPCRRVLANVDVADVLYPKTVTIRPFQVR